MMDKPARKVPRYSRVAHKFWVDEKVRAWSDDLKLLSLYLLTNEHNEVEGLYRLPISYIATDLGWTAKKVRHALNHLEKSGWIQYDADACLILIRNALRFQRPENPNVRAGAVRRLRELPKSPLTLEFLTLARRHLNGAGDDPTAQQFLQVLLQEFRLEFEQIPELPKNEKQTEKKTEERDEDRERRNGDGNGAVSQSDGEECSPERIALHRENEELKKRQEDERLRQEAERQRGIQPIRKIISR